MASVQERSEDELVDRIRVQTEAILEREIATALRRMEAHGELSEAQREQTETMGRRIRDQLILEPLESSAAIEEETDRIALAMARVLERDEDELDEQRRDASDSSRG